MGDNSGIAPLSLRGDISENWKVWRARFENYLVASELIKKDDQIQTAQCLHYVGDEAFKVYTTFKFQDDEKGKLQPLLQKFEHHFVGNENIAYKRYKFFTCRQDGDQTTADFILEVKKLASKCELQTLKDDLTLTVITCGIKNEAVREKLLQEGNLTLEKGIEWCQRIESAESQSKVMGQGMQVKSKIKAVYRDQNIRKQMVQNFNKCGENEHPTNKIPDHFEAGGSKKKTGRGRIGVKAVIKYQVPRREDTNPKTIDQIQKEAETEQLNIHVMNMNIPRKDDRSSGPRGGGQRQKVTDDGWVSARNTRTLFSIQPDKIRAAKLSPADVPLGSSQVFSNWGKGAGGSKNTQHSFNSTNIYAPLENMDIERRPMNSRGNRDHCSSKGPNLERNSYKSSYDGRGSRSGAQHRYNTPMRSGPPSTGPKMIAPPLSQPKPQPTPAPTPAPVTAPELTEEQIQRRIQNLMEEFNTGYCTTDEFYGDITPHIAANEWSKVVYECYYYSLEKSQIARLKTGELLAKLISKGHLSLDSFVAGLEELLSLWEDLVIDIPQIWQYFAEDLAPLFLEEVMPIDRLHKMINDLISKNVAQKLLKPLFAIIVKEKGPNFLLNTWQSSDMQLSDFMSKSEEQTFIAENSLEFLVGGVSPVAPTVISYENIQKKLLEFFRNKTNFDDIVNWISANVGDRVKERKFIRALATAIFEDSISKNKHVPEVLTSHGRLFQKYVDNNIDYELQCLYALQSLVHKLEHPQGVALKQLISLFTHLNENSEDEEYSSNSEDA